MAGPWMRISVGASLSSLGVPHAAATAMEYAANAYSCPRGARSSIATRQQVQSLFAEARASGWMIGNKGDHPQAKNTAPNAQYNGQWAYDQARKMLTFDFSASVTAVPGRWSDNWQIELLGCRTRAVVGRDRRMVFYILEYAGAE